ncbi:TBP-associated factor 5 [Perilla frutescens var. frutescens]|nr:TBP-associated factor 5 [Perilla frutescens var. frutescens]
MFRLNILQLSLSAADLIRRHVLCNCKSGPMALKLEEQQFLGEASCTLSEIATKVDGTSTLNLALEEVPSPAHTHHSGQLTIYAEESVAVDTTAAETGEKLSILMSAGQNHQDKIQLLVDKYSENNQHTCLDLNPTVAIDITGDRNANTDSKSPSIVQNLQKLELGKHVFTLALTAILGLLFSQKLEDHASSPHYLMIVGFMVLTAVIWNGISFGEIYPCLGNILQLLGITLVLCLLCLLVGTFLPAGFSSVCWLSAVLYLLPFLYLIIKPHPQPYLQRRKVGKDGAPNIDSEKADGEAREGELEENKKDLLMLALHVKKLKKDKVVGATTKALRLKSVAASGAPHVKPELALPVIPVEVEQSILEDLRNRVQLSSMALPSISFYTFINTHDSLNCASISQDGSMIAGGFSDSSLKVDYFSMHSVIINHRFLIDVLIESQLTGLGHDKAWATEYNLMSAPSQGENELASSEPSSSAGGRCYTLFRGHAGPVPSATFCPFGDFILSSSADSTIRLWSTKLNANLVCCKGHNYPFSPMSHYFASASHDRTARIWLMDRIQPLRIMASHLSDVDCVQWHANWNYISTGSSDKTVSNFTYNRVLFLNSKSGSTSRFRLLKTLPTKSSPVYALQFSRRNLLFAAGALSKQS